LGGISKAGAFALSLLALSACNRRASEDTNLLLGRCSTTIRTKGQVPRLPNAPTLRPGLGGVIGTLADSGGALPHYPILAVFPGDPPGGPHVSATPDSVGGFAFDALTPGRYRLFVRAFAHRPDSTDVEVSAGRVDTVNITLQFFGCVR
jgi:carboxypeptidase family protein